MARSAKKQRNTSVENTGTAGYEYQYLVTTWFILLFWETGLESCVVEGGREDATLDLRTLEGRYCLEVQIKSEKGGVTVRRLASWLTHFPSRRASNPLLEWLQESDQRGVTFVAAGRVENELTGLLPKDEQSDILNPREKSPILRQQAKDLRDAIGNCYEKPSPTKLERARRQYCAGLAKKLRLDELKRLSRRIFILEQMSQEKVAGEVNRLLNNRFRVPQSEAGEVRDRLAGLFPRARKDGVDLVPLFREVLQDYIQPKIFSEQVHVDRGREPELIAELRTDGVLLLSGPMLCGKTHTGRSLAQKLQDEGFNCREIEDLDEAKRFLLDRTTPEDRLVLLEDPLGKITIRQDAYEQWEALGSLIAALRPNRKLIVSTRKDILLSLVREREPRIEGRTWKDLELTDPVTAVEIWRAHALAQYPEVIEVVAESITQMEIKHLLQPGEIRFLARTPPDLLRGIPFEQLLRIARYQAPDIATRLISLGTSMRETLTALALSATTLTRVSVEELTFILGESEDLPGKLELEFGRGHGGPEQPAPQFPSYSGLGVLAPGYREALDMLETQGLVEQADGYRFSHPLYEQASLEALKALPKFQFERAMQLARRSMFSLSSATAKTAVETLHRLRRVETSTDRVRELTGLAFEAFDSIFPVVRDSSMQKLMEEFETLDVTSRKRLIEVVRSQWGEREDILWHKGEPWFDTRDFIPFPDFFAPSFTLQEVANAQEHLRSLGPGDKFPADQVWTILKFYVQGRHLSDVEILERALSHDEVLIRGGAAFLLFRDHISGAGALLDRAMGDPNPVVIAEAIRGLLKGWERHGETACTSVCEMLLPALEHPSRAILVVELLTQFEAATGRYDGKNPWKLWAAIAPSVLRALPRHSQVNEGRLYRMFTMAIPSLGKAEALAVLEAWVEWIEGSLAERLPHDYGLGITEVLLRITGRDAEARQQVMPRLLAQNDTSFRVTVVSDFVNDWSQLGDSERRTILDALMEPRVDRRWVQAAALTVNDPPWEVIETVLGDAAVLLLPEEAILERFPKELLDACLSMHTGHPQPLYWIGLHHRASETWGSLLRWISRDPQHFLFDLSIRELLLYFSERDTSESQEIWNDLAQRSDLQTRNRLFEHLLRWTARMTGAPFKSLWKAIFESAGTEQLRQQWFERIFAALSDIESSSNLDLFLEVPGFLKALWGRFPEDLAVLKLLTQPVSFKSKEQLMEQYERNPPKLLRVHDKVIDTLGGGRDSLDPLVQRVIQVRHEWFDSKDRDNDPWDDHYKIPDWVWTSR